MPYVELRRNDGMPDHPLTGLGRDDLELVTEFVIQSGSLKGVAATYGVSYPTIRARLDRVIERLKQARAGWRPDPLLELLARLVEGGELNPAAARAIVDVVRQKAAGGPSASGNHSDPRP